MLPGRAVPVHPPGGGAAAAAASSAARLAISARTSSLWGARRAVIAACSSGVLAPIVLPGRAVPVHDETDDTTDGAVIAEPESAGPAAATLAVPALPAVPLAPKAPSVPLVPDGGMGVADLSAGGAVGPTNTPDPGGDGANGCGFSPILLGTISVNSLSTGVTSLPGMDAFIINLNSLSTSFSDSGFGFKSLIICLLIAADISANGFFVFQFSSYIS